MADNIQNGMGPIDMATLLATTHMYDGLSRSCRYAVRIIPPEMMTQIYGNAITNDLTYLCEATEFPGRGFVNVDVRYYGPTHKLPVMSQYEDLNMTFLCRNKSYERQFFDDWLEIINPSNTYDFSYRDLYSARIQMFQLSDFGNEQEAIPTTEYMWTLHDAYPNIVNPQPVTWTDDNFQRLTIGFTYFKWNRENRDAQPGTYDKVIKEYIR